MAINKQQFEVQLRQIFRMMLENKTQEEIAHELNINVRTVQRYYQRIEKRYGEMQRQKTDKTIFLECSFFKNRMLKLYKILEEKAVSSSSSNNNNTTNGHEIAKCCEVAADIAINVLKMESEGIKAVVKELLGAEREAEAAKAAITHNNSDSSRDLDMMMDDDLEESC